MTVEFPCRLVSVANLREHWRKKAKRTQEHRSLAYWSLVAASNPPPALPVVVTMTRIAPRELDDDNLRSALKAVRDGIADYFHVDDRDPRIVWRYEQAKGKPREYAVRITIDCLSQEANA